MITIELPFLPPRSLSPNARVHWAVRMKDKREWEESIYIRARELAPPSPFTSCVVRYHLRWCGTPPDRDNLIGSMKAGLDGLVSAGLIEDDSPGIVTDIHVSYERVPHRSDVAMVIEVEPIEGTENET